MQNAEKQGGERWDVRRQVRIASLLVVSGLAKVTAHWSLEGLHLSLIRTANALPACLRIILEQFSNRHQTITSCSGSDLFVVAIPQISDF